MTMAYMPVINCAKCGRLVSRVSRMQVGNQRFLRASCHGETADIDFVPEPNQVVTVFKDGGDLGDEEPAPSITAQLNLTADRIAAVIPIAKAIIDGRKAMSLLDKLDLVAERRTDLNTSLSEGADVVLQRYAEVKLKGLRSFDKHTAQLDAEDKALDKTDAAIDRMSNSLGNSPSSETSSEKPNGSAAEVKVTPIPA